MANNLSEPLVLAMKLISSVLSTCVAATLALSVTVSAAPPAPRNTGTVDVKTGATSLTLSQEFKTALTGAEIKLQKVIPGRIVSGRGLLNFPISGGAVDLATTEGEVTHTGGVAFVKGEAKISVTDLVISTPEATDDTTLPTLSALVVINGAFQGRVNLCSLDISSAGLTAPLTLPKNGKVVLKNVSLKLTVDGANALNTAFTTDAFTADTVIGTATVNAITVKGSL